MGRPRKSGRGARTQRALKALAESGSRSALEAKLTELEEIAAEVRDERSWTALANIQRLIVSVIGEIAALDEAAARTKEPDDITPEQAKQQIADAFRSMPQSLRADLFDELAAIMGQPIIRVVG